MTTKELLQKRASGAAAIRMGNALKGKGVEVAKRLRSRFVAPPKSKGAPVAIKGTGGGQVKAQGNVTMTDVTPTQADSTFVDMRPTAIDVRLNTPAAQMRDPATKVWRMKKQQSFRGVGMYREIFDALGTSGNLGDLLKEAASDKAQTSQKELMGQVRSGKDLKGQSEQKALKNLPGKQEGEKKEAGLFTQIADILDESGKTVRDFS